MSDLVRGALISILKHQYESGAANVVLKDISLTVHQGEVVVLIGPSGCGESQKIFEYI